MLATNLTISAAAGSASTPSIAFTGDLNTGLYSPGADQLAVSTGGTGRLFIDSSGRVGIGTSSPAAALEIANIHGLNNTITRPFIIRNYGQPSATGYGVGMSFYYPNGSNTDFEAASIDSSYTAGGNYGNLIFSTNNNAGVTERARIDNSGRVGIGTSSPGATVDVIAGNDAGILIRQTTSNIGFTAGNYSELGLGAFFRSAGIRSIQRDLPTNNNSADLAFFATTNANVYTERLRITSEGNVGIGTSSPAFAVDVSAANDAVVRSRTNGNTSAGFIGSTNNGTNNWFIGSRKDSIGGSSGTDRFNLLYDTNAFLTVTETGNVGIGTSSPDARLQVNQAISNGTNTFGVYPGIVQIYNSQGISNSDTSVKFVHNFSIGDVATGEIGTLKTDYFASLSYRMFFRTGGAERMTIDSSGNVGIGTSSPGYALDVAAADATANTGYAARIRANTTAGAGALQFTDSAATAQYGLLAFRQNGVGVLQADGASSALIFSTNSTERLRIDSSGRLLVGTSTARTLFGNTTATSALQVEGTDGNTGRLSVVNNFSTVTNGAAGQVVLARSGATSLGSYALVANNNWLGLVSFQGGDGTAFVEAAEIKCEVDGTPGADDMPGRLVFSTTADGASSPTERMRITSADSTSADGALVFYVGANGYQATDGRHGFATYKTQNTATANAANSVVKIGLMQTTSRSINAAGTVNASGADYAEYMTKAGEFEIAKGDVCGVTADGKLTNVFVDAVGFLVKSTNPSYVGGDTWGLEEVVGVKPGEDELELLAEWEATLETERQKVDRIAFAGQVPVNVTGATPGQYIVPAASEDGGIVGVAKNKSEMTPAEYMDSVGKVIAIEDDGRARIIVKVA